MIRNHTHITQTLYIDFYYFYLSQAQKLQYVTSQKKKAIKNKQIQM